VIVGQVQPLPVMSNVEDNRNCAETWIVKGLHKGFLFAIVAILLESPGDINGVDKIWSS
jgi:hypothetical protein